MGGGVFSLLLFMGIGLIQVAPLTPTASFDFSKSSLVWAQGNDGSCLYVVRDLYLRRSAMKQALLSYPRKDLGIEFIVNPSTAAKCKSFFEKAASNAGFVHYRVRQATDRDRAGLIP